jgi:lysyl-tRNA synthetase class 2
MLIDRAAMFAKVRDFFSARAVLEVDCPALSLSACVDTHIDVMQVKVSDSLTGYLHTSPEYGMKQLLSLGIGDIFQMSHVFRKGEISPLHQPEFTMVEWYRLGFSFEQMIEETLDFIRLFVGDLPAQILTYRQAFLNYVGIDYVHATQDELLQCAKKHKLDLSSETQHADRDTLLQCLMSFIIEPNLPKDMLVVIRDYPATQAALAQTHLRDDEEVAERFEIYFKGIELSNGYHELTHAEEQLGRFEKSNQERQMLGKEVLPIDFGFLDALKRGLPECCGVAVGFDRLMLLRHQAQSLSAVLPVTILMD